MEGACDLEKDLVLEALQIGVTAKAEETRVSGVLPTELPSFLADESVQECSDLTFRVVVGCDSMLLGWSTAFRVASKGN